MSNALDAARLVVEIADCGYILDTKRLSYLLASSGQIYHSAIFFHTKKCLIEAPFIVQQKHLAPHVLGAMSVLETPGQVEAAYHTLLSSVLTCRRIRLAMWGWIGSRTALDPNWVPSVRLGPYQLYRMFPGLVDTSQMLFLDFDDIALRLTEAERTAQDE